MIQCLTSVLSCAMEETITKQRKWKCVQKACTSVGKRSTEKKHYFKNLDSVMLHLISLYWDGCGEVLICIQKNVNSLGVT